MQKSKRGFTLIELLVVIVLIVILAASVMIAINPVEMMRKGRDATRLSDLTTVRNAINLMLAENVVPGDSAMRNSQTGTRTCSGGATDWINMDVCKYLATLPVDPTNDATYRYEYGASGGKYELRCKLEAADNVSKMENDGGSSLDYYEIGTSLTIL